MMVLAFISMLAVVANIAVIDDILSFCAFLRYYRLSLSFCVLAKYSVGVITGMSCLTKSLTFRVTIISAFAALAE